jgi:hypothetical protein
VKHGNLFCTVKCGESHAEKQVFHHEQLTENGFEQDPNTPNIYRKNGVAITLERTLHVGVSEAIKQHGHVRIAGASQGEPGDASGSGEGAESVAGVGSKAAGIA